MGKTKYTRRVLRGFGHLLCLACLLTPPPRAEAAWRGAQEARRLGAGESAERELNGGQAHVYEFSLAADQYLRVVVEQRGIDVVVRLFAPGGETLIEIDNPNGTHGLEPLSFVANATGSYRLEVLALKDAAPGRYEVRVEELRAVSTDDKRRIAGEFQAAADKLLEEQTADSALASAPLYEQALLLWHSVGDAVKQVDVLNTLGNVYRNNFTEGQQVDVKSITYYERALPLARAAGYQLGAARALYNIALHQTALGEYRRALDYANESLALVRALGNRKREATVLGWVGTIHYALGEPQQALDYFLQSLELARAERDFGEQARALTEVLLFYVYLGDGEKAFAYAEELLALYDQQRAEPSADVLVNVGITYSRFGEWSKALDYFGRSLAQFRSRRAPYGEVLSLLERGRARYELGDRQKALEDVEAALKVLQKFEAPGSPTFRLADILILKGEIYSDSGDQAKALELYEQALRIYRAQEAEGAVAAARSLVARAEYRRDQPLSALPHIEAALEYYDSFRARVAGHDLRTSYFASVADGYQFYIDLLMQLHKRHPAEGFDLQALRASERARARGLLDLLAESGADIREGVDPALLGRERALQRLLREHGARLARLRGGGPGARELAESARKDFEAALIHYQEVQSLIRQRSPRYAELTQPQPLDLRELQGRLLDAETLLLEYSLGRERSYLWAVTSDSVLSYELPGRAALEKAAKRVYELLTARNQSPKGETYAERQERIRRADAEYPAAAAELSRMVLTPTAAQLSRRHLLIVADGPLQFVPFAALPKPSGAPARPLVADHEIVYLPSAAVLSALRREGRQREAARKTVAVLADPVFDGDDARVKKANAAADDARRRDLLRAVEDTDEAGLPTRLARLENSRWEAERIVSLVPKREAMSALDFAANRATAISPELGRYRIVHFATHAFINSRHPELSGVVLSMVDEQGRPQDGFLRAHEIFNLKLAADLIVLSACRTALGREVRSEGLMGLARAFMYAGSPRVVVSLWSVADRPTAELMASFYQKMLGAERLTPAAALRAAQIEMSKGGLWEQPYFWAAFSIQGEPASQARPGATARKRRGYGRR
ncbi:MAG TPA: CHAT domain-containing protein [Pyrinomonadaceae bacterium]